MTEDNRWPIDHEQIIDGFNELAGFTHYHSFEGQCGTCGAPVPVAARLQKHLLEQRGVPFKALFDRAVFCLPCRHRRAAINRYKRAAGRLLPIEREQFDRLRATERQLKSQVRPATKLKDKSYPYRVDSQASSR